ncbi:MAG: hypothetical protein H6767_01315 [Candidatus Peribacteria bacterium]|nr:MAG: hypothetical protein H6767_01315 [Candidatus Peribacteria bacterium]
MRKKRVDEKNQYEVHPGTNYSSTKYVWQTTKPYSKKLYSSDDSDNSTKSGIPKPYSKSKHDMGFTKDKRDDKKCDSSKKKTNDFSDDNMTNKC